LRSARRFPFVLLPAAKGLFRETVEKYIISSARTRPFGLIDDSYDYERLSRIEDLGPIACYVGVRLWKGYAAFEFQHSDKVILECPRTGNATYILSGEWRRMISIAKAELRSEYRHLVTRVFHTSGWEVLVRRAVFGSTQRSRVVYVPPGGFPSNSSKSTSDRLPR
jgi:hypothetical protein